MNGAQSISTRRAYGLQRICRVWRCARSSVYARRQATLCIAPGFLDSGLTVFASTRPRPARRGHVAPGRGFDSGTSPTSTVRYTSA